MISLVAMDEERGTPPSSDQVRLNNGSIKKRERQFEPVSCIHRI